MTLFTNVQQIPLLSYDFIMVDPPWYFKNRSPKGEGRNATAYYKCWTISDIKALQPGYFAAPDCALMLWCCHPMLRQGLEVLDAWGFRFVTSGVWVKKTVNNGLCFGNGYALRSASEPFLIGSVGAPKYSKSCRTVIEGLRREHSRKPDEAFAWAEKLLPSAQKRLELFSRESRDGWDTFGDEGDKFDER
jgi:N6-adenosine-specific RNA methylase IME4